MTLKLEEVTTDKDFDEILPVLYAAFGEPYNALRQWFIPVHTDVDDAIEAAKVRTSKKWKEHDNIHWIKVTDTDSGMIIGAAEWEIRESIPKADGDDKPINAYWHTEGTEEKEFAGTLITQLKGFMKDRMTRPHLELEQIVVHPDARGQGAGRMLLGWGVKKADELNLESCVESVPFAVPLYETCGFGTLEYLKPDFTTGDPSQQWDQWASEDLRVFLCWRPAGKDFRPNEDIAPWP
ncbi:hypothetical protein K491DRAFT_714424 [Lophiostoma macrostomum CBS 122681]|uniref:N-acetyltransferase domain-containing protein n=1 Tax=Lophiostoma macrostomum CBS 122681 TaxID=1314788 RepID=A0A6A6TDI8_9PLEO|nr:hypothetical protein K491DRAFT_714424 [Lophiostoma macrostomum CBS 122681]